MCPTDITRSELDSKTKFMPHGWSECVYKLNDGPLRLSKSTIDFKDGLVVEELHFADGHVRADAKIEAGRLTIGIFESHNPFCMLSVQGQGQLMFVSYDGSDWDMTAIASGTYLTVNIDTRLAASILDSHLTDSLKKFMQKHDDRRSLILDVSDDAALLADLMRLHLRRANDQTNLNAHPDDARHARDKLISQIRAVVTTILTATPYHSSSARQRRYQIAKDIERTLWTYTGRDHIQDLALKQFALRFGVNARTIQLAIRGYFGTNFKTLQHRILLYRARNQIRRGDPNQTISEIAPACGFDHLGRFSSLYKAMFGKLPSKDLKYFRSRNTAKA